MLGYRMTAFLGIAADPGLSADPAGCAGARGPGSFSGSGRMALERNSSPRLACGPRPARPVGKQGSIRLRGFSASAWAVAAMLASTPVVAGAATAAASGSGPAPGPALQQWLGYLQKLQSQAGNTAAVQAAHAGVKAGQGSVSAQDGNVDLALNGGYSDYPTGLGTNATSTSTGSFTNLEQYGEVRASWGLLDFFGRRPGRIASAQAQVRAARANSAYTRQSTALSMMDRAVSGWVADYQRQALQKAMAELKHADEGLATLHNRHLTTHLENAVAQAISQSLALQSQVEKELASLPSQDKNLPQPPDDYWALPPNPPTASAIAQVAKEDPQAEKLRAESRSFSAQQRADWAKNFHFKVYGGYVVERLRGPSSGTKNGPVVGANLVIPIGGGGGGDRANAYWQSQQKKLAAEAEVDQQKQLLRQMRQQWRQTAAGLRSQRDLIRYQAEQLHHMLQRHQASAISPNAPEPWQLRLEAAQFWSSVADAWKARGQWVELVLAWSLYDNGDYLKSSPPPEASSAPKGLCAPLAACPRI